MKKVAIILSGSGVFDGAEIHESVLTMLAVSEMGGEYTCFAPNVEQSHVINHLTSEVAQGHSRNVLEESARIARGDIQSLDLLSPEEFDALLLPGGFGAAKNLCDFAFKGEQMKVNESVLNACRGFAKLKKPVGYACIAPVIIPKVYPESVKLTIGNDPEVAQAIESMGAVHITMPVEGVVVDNDNLVVSTPAYMLAEDILQAKSSIYNWVEAVFQLVAKD